MIPYPMQKVLSVLVFEGIVGDSGRIIQHNPTNICHECHVYMHLHRFDMTYDGYDIYDIYVCTIKIHVYIYIYVYAYSMYSQFFRFHWPHVIA